MKKNILLLFFLFSFLSISGQVRRDALWCFGDSVLIDFNQSPPAMDYCATRSRGTACSIADSLGELLFYTQTGYDPLWQTGYYRLGVVWNSDHQIMENGDSLIGAAWYKEMIIVPDPESATRFYLFHTDEGIYKAIYYSVIDLNYNGGLGKVTEKNILLDSLNGKSVTDGLTAIKHGNGRDWWLIFRTYGGNGNPDNLFYKFLVTPQGISAVINQNIGFPTWAGFLSLTFNNKGNQMVLINAAGLTELYDFDRCTGMLSNVRRIHSETFDVQDYNWDCAFSPNDSVLYVNTTDNISYLYQYDLTATPISSSKQIISVDTFPLYSGALKLAIDGKIYRANAYTTGSNPFPYPDSVYNQYNMNLSVINNPNVIGPGCDFQPYSFYLGGHRTYWGLPNNPNYDMIALGGSICDTLGLPNGMESTNEKMNWFSVYPNPTSEYITLFFDQSVISQLNYRLIDLTGRIVDSGRLNGNTIGVHSIPNGIYSLSLFSSGGLISSVKVAVLH